MKHILRHLPFSEVPSTVQVAGQSVPIRSGQIVVWASLSVGQVLPKDSPRFPAVLDTGHNHNFSIRADHLTDWASLRLEALEYVRPILVNRREVRLFTAFLWIYRNRPGTTELLPRPHLLHQQGGIAVHPEVDPRLPLIGTKTLTSNSLRLTVFGKEKCTSLLQT